MRRLIIWVILLIVIGRIVWRFMYAIFDGAGMLEGADASASAPR